MDIFAQSAIAMRITRVVKTPGKEEWCVKSGDPDSTWSGGCYPSKTKAEERLSEVEAFKHMKGKGKGKGKKKNRGKKKSSLEQIAARIAGWDELSKSEVERAKAELKEQLGRPPWLRGIGIGGERGNYCLKVNVTSMTGEVREQIPAVVAGVPVIVEVVGAIRALASTIKLN